MTLYNTHIQHCYISWCVTRTGKEFTATNEASSSSMSMIVDTVDVEGGTNGQGESESTTTIASSYVAKASKSSSSNAKSSKTSDGSSTSSVVTTKKCKSFKKPICPEYVIVGTTTTIVGGGDKSGKSMVFIESSTKIGKSIVGESE